MIKRLLNLSIILLFIIPLYSQNFKFPKDLIFDKFCSYTYSDKLCGINVISDNKLELEYVLNESPAKLSFNFQIKHDEGIPYIELDEEIPLILFENKTLSSMDRKKIYFICFLNEGSKNPVKFGGLKGNILFYDRLTGTKDPGWKTEYINVSSTLIEKDIHYDASNLSFDNLEWNYGNNNLFLPWVEDVPGYGIGEYIELRDATPYERRTDYLLIANGYFSIDKPYLYKQNSRVKQIKVTGLNSGKEKILDVLDTPHPQTVDISFLETQEPFRVTIMDVYKGTKYDDTCINCMEPYPYAVIPYEDSIGD